MKQIIISLFLVMCLANGLAQDEKVVETKITSARVFLSGVELQRKGPVKLSSGENVLVITNVSPYITQGSIRIKGNPAYTIMGVSIRNNYLDELEETPKQKELTEKIESLDDKIERQQGLMRVYTEELNMIRENKNVVGAEQGLRFEDLLDLSEFYQDRIPQVQQLILETNDKIRKMSEERTKLRAQHTEISKGNTTFSTEIVIRLDAPNARTTELEFTYQNSAAGWYPMYDIRAIDVKKPLDFSYKAMVYQYTGHDWDNVVLTLSTADPRQSNAVPIYSSWTLRLENPDQYIQRSRQAYLQQKTYSDQAVQRNLEDKKVFNEVQLNAPNQQQGYGTFDQNYNTSVNTASNYTTTQNNGSNTEFEVDIPYSIPTDGKTYNVEVDRKDMEASYQYYVAPKADPDAFLLSRIANWEQYNLLTGSTNIYFQGTYVGQSFIDAQITTDTMSISLGRDKDIIVDRNRIKDFCKKQTVGGKKKETIGIEIKIRNTKSVPIDLIVVDQIPISNEKDIEISLDEAEGARVNEETGKLSWQLHLEPGATKRLTFIYEVKYPKDEVIDNL